jgi:PAS domain S-box-containing protein
VKNLDTVEESDIQETINSLPVPMASFRVESPNRFVLHANNGAIRTLLKTDGDEAYGRDILEFRYAAADTLKVMHQLLREACETLKSKNIEQLTQLRDGSTHFISYTATPIVINRVVPFVIAAVRDVTDLVQTRRQRQSELSSLIRSHFVVCAWCSGIREANGNWISVERYVSQNSFKRPGQTLCPDCKNATD